MIAAVIVSAATACVGSDQTDDSASPATASPSPTTTSPTTGKAASIFLPIDGYAWVPASIQLRAQLEERFSRAFERLPPVDFAVRVVTTAEGSSLPVRILSVSYHLPEEIPFGALASEIGREFLGSTEANSVGVLDGAGVYMKGRTGSARTESVAFFLGRETFVYAFSASRQAPTLEIVSRLYEANCRIGRCAPSDPNAPSTSA